VRYQISIEIDGKPLIDERVASILEAIKERGSLLAASKALGIPYSRAWEEISRIESIIGRRIVMRSRGGKKGGGSVLTDFGEYIVRIYREARAKAEGLGLSRPSGGADNMGALVVAHSHDPLLSIIIARLFSMGFSVRGVCAGSGLSLAMLALGEADVACIHIYDADRGEYNWPYLERFWVSDRVDRVGGYFRDLVLAYRSGVDIEDLDKVMELILEGGMRVAARNRSSGTRVYLEHLLRSYSKRLGVGLDRVRGLETEMPTHDDVCTSIASGSSDVGLTLRYVAEKHGLRWIHVAWEPYECFILRSRAWKQGAGELRRLLSPQLVRGYAEIMPGYRV